jgi:hypothetical protein
MAPLQHHFEMLGWEQITIVIRFWIIAGLFVALGLGIFYAEWVVGGDMIEPDPYEPPRPDPPRRRLAGLRVLVTGLGISGFAAADALLERGAHVTRRRQPAPGASTASSTSGPRS